MTFHDLETSLKDVLENVLETTDLTTLIGVNRYKQLSDWLELELHTQFVRLVLLKACEPCVFRVTIQVVSM